MNITCPHCQTLLPETHPHTQPWCDTCATNTRTSVRAAQQQLRDAQQAVQDASSNYRDLVRALRATAPSDRALARTLGLSQTTIRDLLRTDRRTNR